MTSLAQTPSLPFWKLPFSHAIAANFLWINASEVFRYFIFVMPMMREVLPMVPDAAPMNLSGFLIWGIWDTILVVAATTIPWLALTVFGPTLRHTVLAGTGVWLTVFGLLWIGIWNMNLTSLPVLLVALPLAWVEMLVAALIVRWFCFGGRGRRGSSRTGERHPALEPRSRE